MDKQTFYLAVSALAVWAIRQLYEAITGATKKNTEATNLNTLAITRLETKIELFAGLLTDIPKLRADIDAAHQQIRQYVKPRSPGRDQ